MKAQSRISKAQSGTHLLAFVAGVSLTALVSTSKPTSSALCEVYRQAEKSALTQYSGERGADYWAWQSQNVETGGQITALLFDPYTSDKYKVLDFGCGSGTVISNRARCERVGV